MAKSSIVRFFRYLQFQFTSRLQPAVASGRRGGAGVLLLLALSECSFWCSSGWCFMAFFWCCGVVLSLPRRTPEEGGAGILPLLASGFFWFVFLLVFLLAFFWSRFWCSSGSGCSSGVGVVLPSYREEPRSQKNTRRNIRRNRAAMSVTAVRQTEMNC